MESSTVSVSNTSFVVDNHNHNKSSNSNKNILSQNLKMHPEISYKAPQNTKGETAFVSKILQSDSMLPNKL
jgi:hypothetical protein